MNQDLRDLLATYARESETATRGSIESSIWQRFGCARAVLVVDMSGFSRLSETHGIVHYLSMIHRMHTAAQPIIEGNGGQVVKFEADNAFAVFIDAEAAIQAAVLLNQTLEKDNRAVPDEHKIFIACGIDYGDILLIDDADIFGTAMNRASKLGEDTAKAGEILVTATAYEHVRDKSALAGPAVSLTISGIDIEGISIAWQPTA